MSRRRRLLGPLLCETRSVLDSNDVVSGEWDAELAVGAHDLAALQAT